VFGNFKNVFRLSSTSKGNSSSLQGKEAVEPVKGPAISGDTSGQVIVVDSSGAGPPPALHEDRSEYGDEMQSMASSVDSRSVNTATVGNKASSYPKNGTGLAKLLRKSSRPEVSVEQKKPSIVPPITASEAFASALFKVDHLTVLMHDIESARQELELENGPQTRVRAEGLREDIDRVQKNRLQRLKAGAADSDRRNVIAMAAMDESAIRKMFDELRNGSASASESSTGQPSTILSTVFNSVFGNCL
jgi:hypothetical protein